MNGVHDDAGADIGVGGAGQHLGEVENDFARAVGDDGEVAVGSFCHIGSYVEFENPYFAYTMTINPEGVTE